MQSNVFKRDPIIINWWSIISTEWSVSRLVVIGNQSPEIRKALDAKLSEFTKHGKVKDDKLLKSYYGPTWRVKLGFEHLKRGGDALEVDVELDRDLVVDSQAAADNMNADTPEELEPQKITIPGPEEDVPVGDDDSANDAQPDAPVFLELGASDPLEITMEDMVISLDDLTTKQNVPTPSVEPKSLQFIYDMDLFPEDKVSELKYKINLKLGIPIFRQHLWYRTSGQSFPMQYRFYQGGSSLNVDMSAVIHATKAKETICGMPINMFLYRNKDSLKIEAYDNFTLLGNIYSKNGVSEYQLVDLETFVVPFRQELVEISKSDKYQLQMLYFGFIIQFFPQMNIASFVEYIDEKTIKSSYPQLEPSTDDLAYVPRQQKLMVELYDLYENDSNRVNRIDAVLQKSLTETTLKVNSTFKGKTINLRVLFDLFETDKSVDALKLYDVYDGKHILIDKYYLGTKKSTEKLIPGVLYFRVIISTQPYQRLNLFLYPNGAYAIRGVWGEDQNYEFSDINILVDRHINPIIQKINGLASKIMYHGSSTKLQLTEKSNVKYIDISISLFWKKILSTDEFRQLKTVLDKFVSAKIIVEKQVDKNSIQYFFKKGMYEFDPKRIEKTAVLDNYYSYLFNSDIRQKWFMLFENIRVLTVTHRFSDIKIEISGIKEDEYNIFIRYIVLLMSIFMRDRQDVKSLVSENRITKPLSNLKEQDPHLYNFKKIYNSEVVYSKICQKPYQPSLLTQQQYDKLDKTNKDSTVKYWNFTTNTDAYYQCPNQKYPHVRFIIGKHPMGYCIPCCKITAPPTNIKDKQRQIYDRCLKQHTFEKREVERSTSRYIMSYGKPIDIGRLSHLPETSMEPLFYETKIEDHGHQATEEEDDELIGAKYYLFGVPQNWHNIKKVGVLHCFSNAMGMNVDKLVELIITKLNEHTDNFQMLLGGTITFWFKTPKELISAFTDTFLSGPTAAPSTQFEGWNELVMDIALQFLEIYTITFEDRDTVIQLRLPDYLDNIADMQYPTHRHMILLHNLATDYWNPVYIVHKDLYFRAGIVDRKLFNFQSDVIQLIMEMVKTKSKDEIVSKRVTFDIMKRFIEQNKRYEITKLLVTRDNLCYGVVVDGLGYVPVHLSHFKFQDVLDISFKSDDIVPVKLHNLQEFIRQYNTWVSHESERNGFIKVDVPISKPLIERIEPIYPLLDISRYLVYHNKCVAFISCGLNFYIEPTKPPTDKRVLLQHVNYNPTAINTVLEKYNLDGGVKPDTRTQTINKALYKNYIYQLLILEFIQMFNRQRNLKVRESLKRLFMKTDFKQPTAVLIKSIFEIVLKGFDATNVMLLADIEKLKGQIVEFILSGESKRWLMSLLDTEYYNFDMILVERLKKLPRKQIHEQLKKLAINIVQIGSINDIKDFAFPNILQSCQGTSGDTKYCSKQGKLIISRADLDRYLEILADQIKNPFVEKYLFSPLFQNSLIDYFKIISRKNETIEIEFLN